jgi:hypothetical protein
VVRIPLSSRRHQDATRDENADTSVDTREKVDERTAEYRSGNASDDTEVADQAAADQAAADQAAADRAAAERAEDRAEAERAEDRYPDRPADAAPAMPRPRASGLAIIGLVFGVAAALFVLTGTLAGYGIALGAIALIFSLGGMSATSRFHVAGRTDAMLGLLLGLGAVVVGILAVTDTLSWLSPDTDRVGWLRDWLDTNIVDRF